MRAAGKPASRKIYRVLDANLNRAREGVRVAEEVFRLVYGDGPLTKKMKRLRHAIVKASQTLPVSLPQIKLAREADSDVGSRSFSASERKKGNAVELAMANLSRAQEALRVLEEFSKLLSEKASYRFKKLRFASYAIETELLKRFFK